MFQVLQFQVIYNYQFIILLNNKMYVQNSKSKRYQNDSIDFIIPFLINQSVDKPKEPQPQPTFKRFSVPQPLRQSQSKDIQKIAKIYNIKNQKSKKAISYHKITPTAFQQPTSPMKKTQSTNNYTPAKKRIRQSRSFVKVHSQITHSPVTQISSRKVKPYFGQRTKKEQLLRQNSPILGIKFKQKSKLSVNLTTQDILPPQNQLKLDSFRNQVKKNMKYWRQKRDWDRIRGLNVDLIVNRNCKNFKDLISEYRRRMDINQTSKIFIFDSKDYWMKRVLIDQGWVQNINKQSKAFHLIWSNKIYKEKLFRQQISNHYQNSCMVTTKTGLYNLLKKYGLTYLQPKTFDLATQRQQFVQQFLKTQFICFIKTFLQKFQFQEPSLNLKVQGLLQQMKEFFTFLKKEENKNKQQMSMKLAEVLRYCEQILSNTFVTYDYYISQEILSSINSQYKLSNIQEEAIRIIRDFQTVLSNESIISHYSRIGKQNVWITKSKISSKGAGITLYNSLEPILKHENRMAQKYIEKPLIIQKYPFLGRKFDLRVWVLLVGNKPEVYYHQRFYGRICFQSYSVQSCNLKNQNIHLTNYSQNKQLFTKKNELAQSIVLPQMLFNAVYQSSKMNYRQKFNQDIQKILKKLMIIFKNQIVNRQVSNNFQLFGLDFLLDSALHLHLLQVNLAAHCDERHQSLTEMLENMGRGILNILQNCQIDNFNRQSHGWVNIK